MHQKPIKKTSSSLPPNPNPDYKPPIKESCSNCVHQKICDLWSEQEVQRASCYSDDCFMEKQQHGEWILYSDDPYIVWKCSKCGWLRRIVHKPCFCEECGADMRERRR